MNWNQHFKLRGQHAFLSASKWHWLNYDEDKLRMAYSRSQAAVMGTRIHDVASELISLGIKLPKSKKTLNMYVNDAIGFKMVPEQVLYYSDNCFGTADAISFREKDHKLRIFDLKTGTTPAHMEQLLIYAALFCLEYRVKPSTIDTELRLYQSDDVLIHEPSCDEIVPIMDKIITYDKLIEQFKLEEA